MSRPCAKVVCLIPGGGDCFGCLIPKVSPPPPTLGENTDRYITQKWLPCLKFVFQIFPESLPNFFEYFIFDAYKIHLDIWMEYEN